MLIQSISISEVVDNDGSALTDTKTYRFWQNFFSILSSSILLIVGKHWFVMMKIVLNSLYLNSMWSVSLIYALQYMPGRLKFCIIFSSYKIQFEIPRFFQAVIYIQNGTTVYGPAELMCGYL